ncbi:hypothetical protein ACVWZZ_005182 [Bradyrhizobium sp. LM6.10]
MLHDWGRDRRRLRLYRLSVPGGEPWRPPLAGRARPRLRADLSAVAGDLLHLLDLLRLGRLRHPHVHRLPRDLCRPDPDDRARSRRTPPRDPARESPQHHLDRRLHRRALWQEPGGGGDRRADRDHRLGALYRAPAQGGRLLARNHPGRRPGLLSHPHRRRHGADGNAGDGGLRGAVRHAADRRHRASARPDAGGRNRIHHQAGRLPHRRHLRHVLDVLAARTDRARHEDPGGGARHQLFAVDRQLPDHDAAVAVRDHAAAAPVPRQRGGKFLGCRGQPRALVVSALPRRHQSVRDPDRARRPHQLPVRHRRS